MGHKILILEDSPERNKVFRETLGKCHDLTIVETAAEAIGNLRMEVYDVVFLDHDLGGLSFVSASEKNTGSEVVRFMQTPNNLHAPWPTVVVHSMNTDEAQRMYNNLFEAGYAVYCINFTQLVEKYLDDPSFLL